MSLLYRMLICKMFLVTPATNTESEFWYCGGSIISDRCNRGRGLAVREVQQG